MKYFKLRFIFADKIISYFNSLTSCVLRLQKAMVVGLLSYIFQTKLSANKTGHFALYIIYF